MRDTNESIVVLPYAGKGYYSTKTWIIIASYAKFLQTIMGVCHMKLYLKH